MYCLNNYKKLKYISKPHIYGRSWAELSQYFLLPEYFCLCLSPHSCWYDADWLSCLPLFGNCTETPLGPAASQEAAKDPTNSNSPLLTVLPLTVPQPAITPVVFISSVSSTATVLLMDANKIVTQTPTLSAAASETSEITQLIVEPAASAGSVRQEVPVPGLSVVSGVKTTQVKPFSTDVHFMIQPYVQCFLNSEFPLGIIKYLYYIYKVLLKF